MISVPAIAWRELHRIARTPWAILLGLCVPVFYALFIGAVYWNKQVVGIPVTIIDHDNSGLSRQITQAFASGNAFRLVARANAPEEFVRQAMAGQSHVCLVFPPGFQQDVKSRRPARVAVLVDASNLLVANVAITQAATVLGTYSVGVDIRKALLMGLAANENALTVVQPIQDEYRVWYNPAFNYNYTNFMLLGLVIVAAQLLTLLLVATAGAGEYEDGSAADLYALSRTPLCPILGKVPVYMLLTYPSCVLGLYLPGLLLDVPMKGSVALVLLLTAWLIGNLALAGFGASALVGDSLRTTEIFAIVAMPSYLLSGYTWPVFAMPAALQRVALALPLTPYLMAVRRVTMMGAVEAELAGEFRALTVWTCVGAALAVAGSCRLWLRGRAQARRCP